MLWRAPAPDQSNPPWSGRAGRARSAPVAINGTEYTLNGSLETTIESLRATPSHTGEIRIINNGTLSARIYGDVRNALTIEILVPLIPL